MERPRGAAKFRQTTTGAQLRRKREERGQGPTVPLGYNQRFFSRDLDHYHTSQRPSAGTNFRRSRSTEWDREGQERRRGGGDAEGDGRREEVGRKEGGEGRRGNLERGGGAFHMNTASRPSMKTLDKKISVSSDQLDTLTTEQRADKFAQLKAGLAIQSRASYRFPPPRESGGEASDGDVIFKYKGTNYSKNEYFFGHNNQGTARRPEARPEGRGREEERKAPSYEERKTPYQMFLEDDGPYSRKLYGPVKPGQEEKEGGRREEAGAKMVIKNFVYKSKDYYALESESEGTSSGLPPDCDAKQAVRKGLLWHQRDKLFSRWKERFFILTKDYFHCFKKDSSKLTEMGEFLFKVKLVDIDGVSLLDKRGYLTICVSQLRDGRLYLRRHEGIRDWFSSLQCTVYESKRRRKFWVRGQAGIPYATIPGGGGPSKNAGDAIVEEDGGAADDEDEESDQNNNSAALPRGINRLSLVTDLLMNEALSDEVVRPNMGKVTKAKAEDSGHDSGQSSMNTGCESFSESSG